MLPLVGILNQSLQDGRLPLVWKQANVCPLFKKGDRADPANYGLVSLMLCICNILESVIHDAIYDHLKSITYCVINSLDLGLDTHVICSC